METKLDLTSKTVEAIRELAQANIDSAQCLEEAAEAIDNEEMHGYFSSIATKRRQHATELNSYVSANDAEAQDDSSLGADVRQLWIKFRAAVNGGETKVVLIEAEKAEDAIKGKYEKLLVDTAGSAMNDVLMRHMREIKLHHDQIRDLRDAA